MHYINGEWTHGTGTEFTSENPATGDIIWRGKSAQTQQVQAAVAAAKTAFTSWKRTSLNQRIAILTAFNERLIANVQTLADLIGEEVGKAPWDALGEAKTTTAKLTFSLDAYAERTPDKQTELSGMQARLTHRPHGVMAVYGPYNFPAHIPNGHIMPALLAGNTAVLKPSELTPKTSQWLMEQWQAAGLPAGVLNLLQGEAETGIALANAPIDGLLFTGSSRTGTRLHQQFAGRPEVILALELGGNNPLIVDEGVDPKAAAYETILSAFTGSGQRCTCARRLIIIGKQPAYEAALLEMAQTLKVGAYNDSPAPFMGPVVSNAMADTLLHAQDRWIKLGATALLTMRRLQENRPFVTPGIIDVTAVDNIEDEEYFGPLLKLYRAANLDEAIAIANNTRFGLSAAILTPHEPHAQRALNELHAGLINVNQQTTGASGAAPFGGIGCSGNHQPAGYYAADYCAYPVATLRKEALQIPDSPAPGLGVSP